MRLFLFISSLLLSTSLIAGGDPPPVNSEDTIIKQSNRIVKYKLQNLDKSTGNKFVLVDISHVINPESIPLAFMVHYQKPGEEKIYLGSFALFPANNPGRFIVPTQGKVGTDGEIVLSMEPLQDLKAATSVRVHVHEVKLTNHVN